MRGFASLIAGLVMFVLLLIGVAALVYVSLDAQRVVDAARSYRHSVYEAMSRTRCQILDVGHSDGNLLVVVKNTGEVPVDLTRIALFVNGVLVGRCGEEITCADASGNGVTSPGEELNINARSSEPSRVLVVFGSVTCAKRI